MHKIQLNTYKGLFIVLGLIGVLLFASPAIGLLVKVPTDQQFSELYILGPTQQFEEIPFNIINQVQYLIYVGVGNNLGHSAFYQVYVKLSNDTEFLPDLDLGLPSKLPPLYEYDIFLEDGSTWQAPLTFETNGLFVDGHSKIEALSINQNNFVINESSIWNANRTGYYYNLIIELWNYDFSSGISQYSNRFVYLHLNMTQ